MKETNINTSQLKVLKWFSDEPVYDQSIPKCQLKNVQYLIDIGAVLIMLVPGNAEFASQAEYRRNGKHIKYKGQALRITRKGRAIIKVLEYGEAQNR